MRRYVVGLLGAGGGPSPTVTALPTGACGAEGEICQLVAVEPWCGYPKSTLQGTALTFRCACNGGAWSCEGRYFGGGPVLLL